MFFYNTLLYVESHYQKKSFWWATTLFQKNVDFCIHDEQVHISDDSVALYPPPHPPQRRRVSNTVFGVGKVAEVHWIAGASKLPKIAPDRQDS